MVNRRYPIYYYVGLSIVSIATYLFLIFILPALHPLVAIFILTGMLILVVFSFVIRFRRIRALPQKQEETEQISTTTQYIRQIDEMMRKE
ncbi:MAG: hypothetical protein ACFE9L_16860 [Candidatus Hodarchaeota archaeon]